MVIGSVDRRTLSTRNGSAKRTADEGWDDGRAENAKFSSPVGITMVSVLLQFLDKSISCAVVAGDTSSWPREG